MLDQHTLILCGTAALIGFTHTLIGPDHYLPFIAMSRARNWSLRKTQAITVICGIGHVLSSVILGLVGILFGVAVFKLESIESIRGDIAGWLLLTFGLLYFMWGVRQAVLAGTASADDGHNEDEHHHHSHGLFHTHLPSGKDKSNITPWVLFTIFLFGPCEPLIPLLMYPAAEGNMAGVISVSIIFAVVTISTMTAIVSAVLMGVGKFKVARFSRYGHAVAGLIILLCGLAVTLGL